MRTIADVIRLLKNTGHEPIVLRAEDGRKVVLVTPSLVGRVLGTGWAGEEGATESYITEEAIARGFITPQPGAAWNSFGGEERIWLAPEGGRHGLFFPPGAPQTMDHYLVPDALDSACYRVEYVSADGKSTTFSARLKLTNYQGTRFEVEVTRTVEIVDWCPFTMEAAGQVDFVGFESRTHLRNIGRQPFKRETGALALWTTGQFPSHERTVVMLPYRTGPEEKLGPPVSTAYFKLLNPGREKMLGDYWSAEDGCAFLRANGDVLTKLELPSRRALGRLASIDLASGELCLVQSDVYPELDYPSSVVLPYEGDPYEGGALSSFTLSNDQGVPPFHELETVSPALFLKPGESFCHRSRTYHLKGERAAIWRICERHFNASEERLLAFERKNR